MEEPDFITRRRFFGVLAAGVVAAGLPLPVGLTEETVCNYTFGTHNFTVEGWVRWGRIAELKRLYYDVYRFRHADADRGVYFGRPLPPGFRDRDAVLAT